LLQIREEPPSYSTSVLQRRESFENPFAGHGEVDVLDPMRVKIRVPGTHSLEKDCITSQQAVMMR
jgi:hypothetical protein